ncbi:MAG: DUF2752 domain-containing protein [Lentisphaeria bacterium]|nr:DUF2752 domain-containing protein [Lentisphaeria bacterium]
MDSPAEHKAEPVAVAAAVPAARLRTPAELAVERAVRRLPTPLAGMMSCRWAALTVIVIAGLQVLAVHLGLPGWPCPMRTALGVPCPGCGLSRACGELLRGHALVALRLHAFSWFVPPVGGLLAAAACLPERWRDRLVGWVEAVERRTRLGVLVGVGFMAYYACRLILFRESFYAAVMGSV